MYPKEQRSCSWWNPGIVGAICSLERFFKNPEQGIQGISNNVREKLQDGLWMAALLIYNICLKTYFWLYERNLLKKLKAVS